MIKIAIVDDENFVCSQLEKILISISQKNSIKVDIEVFYSGESFINYISLDNYYDVIFLDIEMGESSGLDVSKVIRETLGNEATQIIYISGKTEYAIDVFEYDPLHFLPKPLTEEIVDRGFQKLIKRTHIKTDAFTYKNGKNITKVPIKDILYFESDKRQVIIYFGKNSDHFYGSIYNVQNQLKSCNFILIHKSFLINPLHVRKFCFDYVEMSNHVNLQIAQLKRKNVRTQLLEYVRLEGDAHDI